ncbi:hypothetical protein ABES23_01925, partial [Peribacillus frigoritolerans]|uniref:hypothetical protein n=1 Tax=Peribacillus frigoritolerans TaxID=450367 RepID=UPI003D2A10D8
LSAGRAVSILGVNSCGVFTFPAAPEGSLALPLQSTLNRFVLKTTIFTKRAFFVRKIGSFHAL